MSLTPESQPPAQPTGPSPSNRLGEILAVERCVRGRDLSTAETQEIASAVAAPETTPLVREPATDIGNARRLAWAYAHALRYVEGWNKWLEWDGARWVPRANVKEYAKRLLEARRPAPAPKKGKPGKRGKGHDDDEPRLPESAGTVSAMISLAESDPGLRVLPKQLDADPWLLNVRNGTVDLRTGDLKPHRRQDLMTKLAPVAYDPDAGCPLWRGFLASTFDDADLIKFLQRAIGYSLTGDTSEQVFFLLHGAGANGKGVLLDTLGVLLGDYYQVARAETFMAKRWDSIPNDLAALQGARFIRASETEAGARLAVERVKLLSGSDPITARYLYGEWFTFHPHGKLWLATNHRPHVPGDDPAVWRRLLLIPFTRTFSGTERDNNLREKLRGELPGILTWAVRGCLLWRLDGGLRPPAAVTGAVAEYKRDMGSVEDFVGECCTTGPGLTVPAGQLYAGYQTWVRGRTHADPLPVAAFNTELTRLGFQQKRTKTARLWLNIALTKPEGKAAEAEPIDSAALPALVTGDGQ